MSKKKVDYDLLRTFDTTPILEFEDSLKSKIKREEAQHKEKREAEKAKKKQKKLERAERLNGKTEEH